MKIHRLADATQRVKPSGTEVYYHLFPEYEIHLNEKPARSVSEWHRHEQISETIIMIGGELEVVWIDERGGHKGATIRAGDIAEVGQSLHTLRNQTEHPARFIVLKQVLTGRDLRPVFTTDKVVEEVVADVVTS